MYLVLIYGQYEIVMAFPLVEILKYNYWCCIQSYSKMHKSFDNENRIRLVCFYQNVTLGLWHVLLYQKSSSILKVFYGSRRSANLRS